MAPNAQILGREMGVGLQDLLQRHLVALGDPRESIAFLDPVADDLLKGQRGGRLGRGKSRLMESILGGIGANDRAGDDFGDKVEGFLADVALFR